MEDPEYTHMLEPEDEPEGSESRFNRTLNSNAEKATDQPAPVFESWYEPQTPVSALIPSEQIDKVETPEITQPIKIRNDQRMQSSKKRKPFAWGWIVFVSMVVIFLFLAPFRATILILGIDRPPKGTWIGRSDTMILTSLKPLSPQVSMISIPRDLWVPIPNYGENRINAAHYFAELYDPGTGMQSARKTVETNFGINVDYVLRLKFDGFVDVVDAFGGVTVDLPTDMSGLTAGKHHLDGTEALKFVRDRKGSDDFYRQQRGQLFLSAAFEEVLNPLKWPRFPAVTVAVIKNVQTDIPFWLWPRLATGFVFSAIKGFDAHTIDRNYVTSWVTDGGAQVLLPNWELILPEVHQIIQ